MFKHFFSHAEIEHLEIAWVSTQHLASSVLPNTEYTLKFDVGQRNNISMQNYTLRVSAGSSALLLATNPEYPSAPGTFSRGEVSFNSGWASGDLLSLTIETQGTGHVNLDNFELSYTQNLTPGYAIVASGWVFSTTTPNQQVCHINATLNDREGQPYMTNVANNCVCNGDSISALKGYHRHNDTNRGVVTRWFYECLLPPQ